MGMLSSKILSSDQEYEPECDKAIEKIVDEIMNNKSINLSMVPDIIERRVYRNLLIMLIGHIKEALSDLSVIVLNHRITVTVTPVDDSTTDPSPE